MLKKLHANRLASRRVMDIVALKTLIEKYFIDNPESLAKGRRTDKSEFEKINTKVLTTLPTWYKDILITYPLVDLEIGIPNDFGDEDLKGKPMSELPLMGLTFISVKEIENRTLKFYPDIKLIDLNFIRIAEDKFGTQEGIFINASEDDPSIRLVFHDMGNTARDVMNASEMLLERFTDIFRYGAKREVKREVDQDWDLE